MALIRRQIASGLLLGSFALFSCDTATVEGPAGARSSAPRPPATCMAQSREQLLAPTPAPSLGRPIDEEQALRYGPRPRGGFPYGRRTGPRGFYQSPYPPHQIYDLRGIPRGGLVEDRIGGGYFRTP